MLIFLLACSCTTVRNCKTNVYTCVERSVIGLISTGCIGKGGENHPLNFRVNDPLYRTFPFILRPLFAANTHSSFALTDVRLMKSSSLMEANNATTFLITFLSECKLVTSLINPRKQIA